MLALALLGFTSKLRLKEAEPGLSQKVRQKRRHFYMFQLDVLRMLFETCCTTVHVSSCIFHNLQPVGQVEGLRSVP